jgi:hypothetical protein
VTAGTIFHRTHSPLSSWFAAVWFVTSQQNGVSALGLSQAMGFGSYETAWAWLHKLRRAMVRPDRDLLSGVVELDETFVGGVSSGTDGAGTDKVGVQIAVEKLGHHRLGAGPLRRRRPARHARTRRVRLPHGRARIAGRTDGARMLRRLTERGYEHQCVDSYASLDKSQELPGVHRVASLLKRWLAATLHYRVSDKHLEYYLDEYAFRFNRRTSRARGMLFQRLLQQAVGTDPTRCTT